MQNRKRDTEVQKRILESVGEGEGGMFRENSIKTCILSRVKQITNPGWMHETSAWAWCTGKTQRDRVEREVGGGSGWGTHVTPWLIHVNVRQKPLQYCKVISLQLIKINEKKIKIDSEIHLEVYTCMNSQDINLQRSLIINKPEYFCLTNKIFQMIKTVGMNRELKNPFWQKDGTLLTLMLSVNSFRFCIPQIPPPLWQKVNKN